MGMELSKPASDGRPSVTSEPFSLTASKRKRDIAPECAVDEAAEDDLQGAKRQRLCLGEIAEAAVAQWGLDEKQIIAWARRRKLPGVGFADVIQYRNEHPEEDIVAGLSDIADGLR